MASPKTRANMARIAAAAVFAAGASLAVVGTASASGKGETPQSSPEGAIVGAIQGGGDEGAVVGAIQGGGDDEGTAVGAIQGGGDEGAVVGAIQGGGDEDTSAGGGDEDTSAGGGDEDTSAGGGDEDTSAGGGDEDTSAGGGDEDTSAGGGDEDTSAGGGDEDTSAGGGDTGSGPQGAAAGSGGIEPDDQGRAPITQDTPDSGVTEVRPAGDTGELAETGSGMNGTLLIAGAATMIAGGVAFRYLPRLINKNSAAA